MNQLSPAEAERQLIAAVDRHREVVTALAGAGPRDQRQHAAAAALARGVQLLAYTVTRGAAAGLSRERLVELVRGDAVLVDSVLDDSPSTNLIDRLTPADIDRRAVARATASFEASVRVGAVVQAIMADVEDPSWSPASPELDDLAERLGDVWRQWRHDLGRRDA